MKRVTEPELMISSEQVKAYAEADFSVTENDLVNELSNLLRKYEPLGEEFLILDLGCGPGNISERISTRWRKSNVLGIDGSSEMIRVANERKKSLNRNSCFKRLRYKKMNISLLAKGESSLAGCADVVVSNSLLHHIHNPDIFFSALLNISKNGAIHFHRDLRRPETFEEALEIKKRNLANAPSIMERDFIASLLAAYTREEVYRFLNHAGIDSFNVTEKDDRYIDIVGNIYK